MEVWRFGLWWEQRVEAPQGWPLWLPCYCFTKWCAEQEEETANIERNILLNVIYSSGPHHFRLYGQEKELSAVAWESFVRHHTEHMWGGGRAVGVLLTTAVRQLALVDSSFSQQGSPIGLGCQCCSQGPHKQMSLFTGSLQIKAVLPGLGKPHDRAW